MFYGKGGGKTGIFQSPAEVNGDCELRDLAQGENSERHKFKCNLESDFQKHMRVWTEHRALAPWSFVGLILKLWFGLSWIPADPQHTSVTYSRLSSSSFDCSLVLCIVNNVDKESFQKIKRELFRRIIEAHWWFRHRFQNLWPCSTREKKLWEREERTPLISLTVMKGQNKTQGPVGACPWAPLKGLLWAGSRLL